MALCKLLPVTRIPVVDDDPRIRSLVHRQVNESGYEVTEVTDGRAALERIAGEAPALVGQLSPPVKPSTNGCHDPDVVAARPPRPILSTRRRQGTSGPRYSLIASMSQRAR